MSHRDPETVLLELLHSGLDRALPELRANRELQWLIPPNQQDYKRLPLARGVPRIRRVGERVLRPIISTNLVFRCSHPTIPATYRNHDRNLARLSSVALLRRNPGDTHFYVVITITRA